MRPSPDGTHVLFTRIVFGQTGNFQALPIVGELTANGDHYDVTNAVVVWPTGESKQWTPDGKGVIIQGGAIEAGNVDDIMVDLSGQTGDILYPGSPFRGTRVTGNLDYDEDIDMSPNKQWITVGSTRGFEALTPMTRIVRQNFLPVYVARGDLRSVCGRASAQRLEPELGGRGRRRPQPRERHSALRSGRPHHPRGGRGRRMDFPKHAQLESRRHRGHLLGVR